MVVRRVATSTMKVAPGVLHVAIVTFQMQRVFQIQGELTDKLRLWLLSVGLTGTRTYATTSLWAPANGLAGLVGILTASNTWPRQRKR